MAEHAELDRRRFLKQASTVAWATPLVLTLTASRAGAQAISCIPTGLACGVWDGSTCVDLSDPPCCGDCVFTLQSDFFCFCLG